MSKNWMDLEANGRRIERLCRMMEKRMKSLDPNSERYHELIVKYTNAIAYATKTKNEIVSIHLNLNALTRLARKKYGVEEIDRELLR